MVCAAGEASSAAAQVQDLHSELQQQRSLVQTLEEDLLAAQQQGLGAALEGTNATERNSRSLDGMAGIDSGMAQGCLV